MWQASDGTRTAYAAAGAANPPEIRRFAGDRDVAAQVAREFGRWRALGLARASRVHRRMCPTLRRTEPDRSASGGSWIGLERRHDHVVTGIASLTLLPAWIALPLMLGLLVTAWRREGS